MYFFVSVVCDSTCVTPEQISGSCIELKYCKYLQKELKRDPNYIKSSRCGLNNPEELADSFVSLFLCWCLEWWESDGGNDATVKWWAKITTSLSTMTSSNSTNLILVDALRS